jgi:hypothetical protein
VLPDSDPDHVKRFIDTVQKHGPYVPN